MFELVQFQDKEKEQKDRSLPSSKPYSPPSHEADLADYQHPQFQFPIVAYAGIDRSILGELVFSVNLFRDSNLLLRACYVALCNNRRNMQQNLLRLSVLLKQASQQLRMLNCQHLKYPYLQHSEVLKKLYSQMLKKWRSINQCSVVILVHRYPIVDEILTCTLRIVLVSLGATQGLLDLGQPLQRSAILPVLQQKLSIQQPVLETNSQPDCVCVIFDKEQVHLLNEITGRTELVIGQRSLLSDFKDAQSTSGMNFPEQRQPQKKKLQLKPLQSCLFYSLLQ